MILKMTKMKNAASTIQIKFWNLPEPSPRELIIIKEWSLVKNKLSGESEVCETC